jgi:transketolase
MNSPHDIERINFLRTKILKAAFNSKEGHIASSFSILDLLYCFYVLLPKISMINFTKDDIFVLSKGHASLAIYAVLEESGIINSSWVENFCKWNSDFGGHPDVKKIREVNASTGSLGHGLPISIGKIFAKRILNKPGKIYCLIGDGELNEGSNWESMLIASHHKMHELTLIVDLNYSNNRSINLGNIQSKFESFGFIVKTINGHVHQEILESYLLKDSDKPVVIIANTIKGYGIKTMENNPEWHHAVPTIDQLNQFISELA